MTSDAHEPIAWHRETITPAIEDMLRAVRERAILADAYLAGGTGLALRFGHRRSVDLDFFLQSTFDEEALLQRILNMPSTSVVQRAPQTLHLVIQGIRVTFLGYAYPLLFAPAMLFEVPIADPRDIACMKISAIASRGAKRDFIDFYAACQRYGLAELLNLFAHKYARTAYNRLHILKALTYFSDAEKDPMPHMLTPLNWADVKQFFEEQVPPLR